METGMILAEIKPQELTRLASDVAGLCRELALKRAIEIQGRKYLPVEVWQSIATAHGCVSGSRDVEQVFSKDGTLLGYKSIGEIRNVQTGATIATAEGFVGCDETTWFGGRKDVYVGRNKEEKILPKRPDYAIRAMCQTRAISRVCRAVFAHVVVLMDAGLSTTPAEEVPDGGFNDAATVTVASASAPTPTKSAGRSTPTPHDTTTASKPSAAAPASKAGKPINSPPAQSDAPQGEWRGFKVPFGKNRGIDLGELTENSLTWYFRNIEVEETYEKDGETKKCSEENIAKQQAFRDALDAAGEELGLTLE